MLKVKTAVDVRQEWTAALRSGKIRQIRREPSDGHGGKCVWGVLIDQLGIPYHIDQDLTAWTTAAAKAGITHAELKDLISKNNEGVPFSVLADEIDALPYTS